MEPAICKACGNAIDLGYPIPAAACYVCAECVKADETLSLMILRESDMPAITAIRIKLAFVKWATDPAEQAKVKEAERELFSRMIDGEEITQADINEIAHQNNP